jgi:hypothetical protein
MPPPQAGGRQGGLSCVIDRATQLGLWEEK